MTKILFPSVPILYVAIATQGSEPRPHRVWSPEHHQTEPVIELPAEILWHLPTIDMSETNTTLIAEKHSHAMHGVGFFYPTGHGMPQEPLDDAFQTSRRFFALTEAQKAAASETIKQNLTAFVPFPPETLQNSETVHEESDEEQKS